jgi:hypothetical protein
MADTELPPRLRVDGPRILKPNGHEFFGRGVSFGSFGEDEAQDVPDVQALGANLVRIPLRWWGLHGSVDVDSRDNVGYAFLKRANVQRWLEIILTAAGSGLWVVPGIDSNCLQSGTQSPDMIRYCDPYGVFGAGGRNLLSDKPTVKLFAAVWQAVAAALRPISHVAMLELLPEPLDGRPADTAAPLSAFYRYLIDAVREVDTDTPILLGARNAYDIELCAEAHLPERGDCIYTGNLLSGKVTDPAKLRSGIAALSKMRASRAAPVWCQQLGRKSGADPTLSHMRSALGQMEDAGIGFAWWQWKQNTSAADEYALNFKDPAGAGWVAKLEEQALLSDFMKGSNIRYARQ